MSGAIDVVDATEAAIMSGLDADGNISDEGMAAALTGGAIATDADLDIDPKTDPVVDPDVDPKTDPVVDPAVDPTVDPAVDPAVDPVVDPAGVMSKSGESIIPYADLIKERDGRHAERDRANDLQSKLDTALKEIGSQAPETPEKTEAGDGDKTLETLKAMFEDYPESEDILKGLTNQNATMTKQLGELRDQIGRVAETSAASSHFKVITDAYKDAETILTSSGFDTWIDGMPKISQEAYRTVFKQGTSEQVVSMLDDFTASQKPVPEPTVEATQEEIAKKVAEAEAKAEGQKTVLSLTDVPGKASPHDEQTAIIDLSQANFMDKMSHLSAAAQLALLDKIM